MIWGGHDDLVRLDVVSECGVAAEQLDPQVLFRDLVMQAFHRQRIEGELREPCDGAVERGWHEQRDDVLVIASKRRSDFAWEDGQQGCGRVVVIINQICAVCKGES